jgi:hypothetical protein
MHLKIGKMYIVYLLDENGRGGLWGVMGVYTPFLVANLAYSYTMEGTKTCPIYPCVPSLEKSWIRP